MDVVRLITLFLVVGSWLTCAFSMIEHSIVLLLFLSLDGTPPYVYNICIVFCVYWYARISVLSKDLVLLVALFSVSDTSIRM